MYGYNEDGPAEKFDQRAVNLLVSGQSKRSTNRQYWSMFTTIFHIIRIPRPMPPTASRKDVEVGIVIGYDTKLESNTIGVSNKLTRSNKLLSM